MVSKMILVGGQLYQILKKPWIKMMRFTFLLFLRRSLFNSESPIKLNNLDAASFIWYNAFALHSTNHSCKCTTVDLSTRKIHSFYYYLFYFFNVYYLFFANIIIITIIIFSLPFLLRFPSSLVLTYIALSLSLSR